MSIQSRHFILTMGRSGSNTLVNVLNQHPELLNLGEVLGEWTKFRRLQRRLRLHGRSDAAYLDALLNNKLLIRALVSYRSFNYRRRGEPDGVKSFHRIKSLGMKEFSLNMHRFGVSSFLKERPEIKVIGLQRHNILDRFISARMLQQTGIVAVGKGQKESTEGLQLNPMTLHDDLDVIERENRELAAMLDALPQERVYRIAYEDLYSTEQRTREILREVYDFLGVEPIEPVMKMRKIIPGRSIERIQNIDACREALRGTRFEWVLAS